MLYLPWKVQKSRVLHCKLTKDAQYHSQTSNLHSIREWVIHQYPSVSTSTHWWFKDLPSDTKDVFYNIAKDKRIIEMFNEYFGKGYYIDLLHDMNEIYVSPPSNRNKDFVKNASDTIFYSRHIDGPFFCIPFASCYRVIVGLDDNRDIMTTFNIIPETYIIKTGDVVGFDYHRECHYISPIIRGEDANSAKPVKPVKHRVILKIHYCVYPRWAYIFGFILSKLTILYNKIFRDLFVFTLKPQSKSKAYLAKLMILTTQVYHDIEFYIGNNNIQYVSLLFYIASKTHSDVFLFGTSFVHYLRWIDTDKHGVIIDNIFRRDYYFFKFLYMLHYFYMYFSYIEIEYPVLYASLAVPIVCTALCSNYTVFIPKCIEIYLTCAMLNNHTLKITEYIFIFVNLFLNYVQLYKSID